MASTEAYWALSLLLPLVIVIGLHSMLSKTGIRPGPIPKFISETRHPWVEENKWMLRFIDTKAAVCNPNSSTGKWLQPIPDDLFETLHFNNNRYASKVRFGHLDSMASDVLRCQNALLTCRSIYIDVFNSASYPRYGDLLERLLQVLRFYAMSILKLGPWDGKLLQRLVEAMSKMPQLEHVHWIGSPDKIFQSEFRPEAAIHHVKHLSLAPDKAVLLQLFPSVEQVTITGYREYLPSRTPAVMSLLPKLEPLQKLVHLDLEAQWSPDMVRAVFSAAPQLQTLHMTGNIEIPGRRLSRGRHMYDFPQFKEVVTILGEFRSLISLDVPFSVDLRGHGQFGIGFCGNAFRGLYGRYKWRKLRRERIWAVETFARIVLDQLPHLQSLGINGAQATSLDHGAATWPWTGRLGDYIKKIDMYCPLWDRNGKALEPENPDGPVFGEWHLDESMLQADWEPWISGQYASSESEDEMSESENDKSESL